MAKKKEAVRRAKRKRSSKKKQQRKKGGVNVLIPKVYATMPPKKLVPNKANPRKHIPGLIDNLGRSFEEDGFLIPILVEGRKIVDGHQRTKAALKIGMKRVPVLDVSHLDKKQRQRLGVKMNRLVGEFDYGKLSMLLQKWGEADEEQLMAMGFKSVELAPLLQADWNPAAIEAMPKDELGTAKSIKLNLSEQEHVDKAIRLYKKDHGLDRTAEDALALAGICKEWRKWRKKMQK